MSFSDVRESFLGGISQLLTNKRVAPLIITALWEALELKESEWLL